MYLWIWHKMELSRPFRLDWQITFVFPTIGLNGKNSVPQYLTQFCSDPGLTLGAIGIDMCSSTTSKSGGICTTKTTASTSYHVADGDYGKVPAPVSSLIVVSIDVSLKAFYIPVIPEPKPCAVHNPCLNGGTCHDVQPSGRFCSCTYQELCTLCSTSNAAQFEAKTSIQIKVLLSCLPNIPLATCRINQFEHKTKRLKFFCFVLQIKLSWRQVRVKEAFSFMAACRKIELSNRYF